MRLALAACVLAAACGSPPPPEAVGFTEAGISLALYSRLGESYAVVDDRRWLEITGERILLANIDPGAELASLVIEPADATLRIGQCAREQLPEADKKDPLAEFAELQRERRALELRRRMPVPRSHDARPGTAPPAESDGDRFVPLVTCDVEAAPGRYLVRILYVTSALGYRAQHDIEVRDEAVARVASRFAIATPLWRERGHVVLYDGAPGGERTPQEIVRGSIELDGSTAVLAVPTRVVPARLRRVYEGGVVVSEDSSDVMWGHDSVQAIWVWLELEQLRLAPGPIRVHLELAGEGVRDLDVAQQSRKQDDDLHAPLRLPLWVDESLRGMRQRVVERNDGASIRERVLLGVANLGDVPRIVYVEERMRAAARRRLDQAWPHKPAAAGDRLRTRLEIEPGKIERTGYTLTYDF